MPPEDTQVLEKPAFTRNGKFMARTNIELVDSLLLIQVNEPYRTVLGRMNKARTHFEVTKAGPERKKMFISVDLVAVVSEI